MSRVLIANRGEVAVRIARSVQDLGLSAVAVATADDSHSLHLQRADHRAVLPGQGPRGYLDGEAILAAAAANNCSLVHPGWGFLAENADFAAACAAGGLTFIGPTPQQLHLFGDKVRARALAQQCGIPVLRASPVLADAQALAEFATRAGTELMVKAVAGGGGRGMQPIAADTDIAAAFNRCTREAEAAFGDGALYAEHFLPRARHIEIQVVGDGRGAVSHLWERDCSIQRRYQKLVEMAPAPDLSPSLRERLINAALKMAAEVAYLGLGTFEFLVDGSSGDFFFIEANPRLQVEHTVTEAVTGMDLVAIQLKIALGASLEDLALSGPPSPPRGFAIQLRINAEQLQADGSAQPVSGRLAQFEPASGPGIRVDSGFTLGDSINPAYDSLVAKLIVHHPQDFGGLLARARRGAEEFNISGFATNLPLLRAILDSDDIAAGAVDNSWVTRHLEQLLARAASYATTGHTTSDKMPPIDPQPGPPLADGVRVATSAIAGAVVEICAAEGDLVRGGDTLAVIEAMKMHHLLEAPCTGTVTAILCRQGDIVDPGSPLLAIAPSDEETLDATPAETLDLDAPRKDLEEVIARHLPGLDEHRPQAVARRRATGSRTARENVEDLCDPGSFMEYGALTIPAQRRRRPVAELMVAAPADGLIAGFATVNAPLFGDDNSRCAVLAYDYTVMAGTQGHFNHKKKDRLFELIEEWRIPTVFYTEGGGGRPGEVDQDDLVMGWLDLKTFTTWPRTSGVAPRIGINSGRCFAGNAVIFGLCDITLATRNSNIGLAGPAMIEGGGLGNYRAEDIGPMAVQTRNGVVDILCEDEADATARARRVMGYFQGDLAQAQCPDQRLLRHLVPENRLLAYDMRRVVDTLADTGTVQELRPHFGAGMITALVRIQGKPFGVIANNPLHLGGAIDSEASDKGAHFLQLCDTFGLPVISLCDTPGFMVGPDSEQTAAVRRGSQLLLASANLTVPLFSITLRKGYGLGAQAMAGGSFHRPFFAIAWPTAEFGPMGFEGAVRLGYRKELAAVADPAQREQLFNQLVDTMYRKGKGVSAAQVFEVDAVIDPADTRQWILRGLRTTGKASRGRRPYLNVW